MKNLIIGFGLAVGILQATALSAQEYNLRVAHSWPTTHPYSINTKAWLDEIAKRTDGRIEFEYFPAEQLAKSADLLDAVINGIADIGYAAPLYISDRLPLSTVTALPLIGNVTDPVRQNEAFDTLAFDHLNDLEYAPQGVRIVRALVTAPYQLMMRDDQVTTMDQLAGQKIRSSGGVQERSVEELSGVPVAIPAPDLYPALQRGTVDGSLFNMPTASGYKLEEQLMWSTDNLNLGLFPVLMVINEDVWQALPEDIQGVIVEAGRDLRSTAIEIDKEREVEFGQALEARGGGLYQIAPEELASWTKALDPVSGAWVESTQSGGRPAEEILGLWQDMLTE